MSLSTLPLVPLPCSLRALNTPPSAITKTTTDGTIYQLPASADQDLKVLLEEKFGKLWRLKSLSIVNNGE
ncbi:hypothetical protein SRHO_G00317250 [Serrasalmus rhombeus]